MLEKVVVLGLNPVIDINLKTDGIASNGEHFIREESYTLTQNGFAVARALGELGMQVSMIVLAGKNNLWRCQQKFDLWNLKHRIIPVEGLSGEQMNMMLPDDSVVRFVREGFSVPPDALLSLEQMLAEEVDEETAVIISGTLPRDFTVDNLKRCCEQIHRQGGYVILNSPAIRLADIEQIRPWIYKVNRFHFLYALGEESALTPAEMAVYAGKLNQSGIEHCLISLDEDGLLYSSSQSAMHVHVPVVEKIVESGAGDCSLAGFVYGLYRGRPIEQTLKTSAALGTAACISENPGLPVPTQMAYGGILCQTEVEKLS